LNSQSLDYQTPKLSFLIQQQKDQLPLTHFVISPESGKGVPGLFSASKSAKGNQSVKPTALSLMEIESLAGKLNREERRAKERTLLLGLREFCLMIGEGD